MKPSQPDRFDLIVIGAGPGGGHAALAAAGEGLRVVLVDEGLAPGGQIWRAPATESARTAAPDRDRQDGDDLRARLTASDVTLVTGASVWSVDRGFVIALSGAAGARRLTAPRLVVATGAQERVVPFPGWTLPGVFGLAAATALLKSDGALPGRRIVIAGQGPLLVAVAAKAIGLGLRPVAVIDRARRRDWLAASAGFLRVPGQFARGAGWIRKILAARVPIFHAHEIASVAGHDVLASVSFRPVGGTALKEVEADTMFVGHGLTPADEILRLLGVRQHHDPLLGGAATERDAEGRTSVPGLFAVGDCGGIRGAASAVAQGTLAGLAAAADAGRLGDAAFRAAAAAPRRRLTRLRAFADASCRLMQVADARLETVAEAATFCRCEDVSAGDLRAAIAAGAQDINQIKHFTRLGMGPCQGRMCGANAGALLRQTLGAVAGPDRLTPRTPVRPVPIADLIGEFDYADIPVPKPAPL